MHGLAVAGVVVAVAPLDAADDAAASAVVVVVVGAAVAVVGSQLAPFSGADY